MENKLFFVSNGAALEMSEQSYEAESYLQKIVEDNPHLLARAWGDNECRLFLIKRELEILESEDGSNSYSLDHLLVGEDGVPVLVEVKRSTDTRIRREVIGQMCDYACRACTWKVDKLRELFMENNSSEVADEFDSDEFWAQVATNLKAEHLRLVFVADKIPDTLRVLIEFLDRNMAGIEVYGVEVRQYKTSDALLLSSSVIGNSLLDSKKTGQTAQRSYRTWSDTDFTEYLREHGLGEVAPVVDEIRDFSKGLGLSCYSGRGGSCPSYSVRMGDQRLFAVSAWWKKSVGFLCEVDFFIPYVLPPLGSDWDEDKLRSFLTDLPKRKDAEGKDYAWSSPRTQYIDIHAFLESTNMETFKQIVKDICKALKESNSHNIQQQFTPPPPNLALLTNCTIQGAKRTHGRFCRAFFFALHFTISVTGL